MCYIGYNAERVHQGQEALWAPVYNGMTRPPQPLAWSTLTPQPEPFHSRDTFGDHYKPLWCPFSAAKALAVAHDGWHKELVSELRRTSGNYTPLMVIVAFLLVDSDTVALG